MSIVDLHTHSTASDGQYTPTELVELAKKRGIEVLALTDHDNIAGVDEAIEAGKQLGVQVIRGVELSADDHLNLHILGYGFPANPEPLSEMIARLKAGRNERKYKIADYLHSKGIDFPISDVEALAKGGVVGRPHFALAMVKHGYVADRKEAFDRYLDTPEFQKWDQRKPSAEKCIRTIKESGGKVSLAHPYQIMFVQENEQDLESLVRRLIGYGLDAIECYYPKHTSEQQAYYLSLAKKSNLYVSGGSDFHGEKNKPDHPLAAWELDVSWIDIGDNYGKEDGDVPIL